MKDFSLLKKMYEQMLLIRIFEKKIEELFSKGKLFGTTHSCIGQEAIEVGSINAIEVDDIITSNHRGHGHYLAYTNDVEGLIGEIMGKQTGVCAGRGGSQHLYNKNFYSNGITGGMVPVATGMAFAEKIKKSSNCVICFLGDGAVSQGVFYESMNLASLWQLPIIFVIENNQYAMSTPVSLGVQGSIVDRGKAMNIDSCKIDTHHVDEVYHYFKQLLFEVRKYSKPQLVLFNTYRLCGHSKSDDCCYRTDDEVASWIEKDPVKLFEKKFKIEDTEKLTKQIKSRIDAAVKKAEKSPMGSIGLGAI